MLNEYFHNLLFDYTLRSISLGTALMGLVCGMIGCFAVLRRQSLLGDAISHAALPGIVLAFMLTGLKSPWILFLGASLSGILASFWLRSIVSNTPLKTDTALGIVLSSFFGFGLLLLSLLQKQADANQAGLDRFLFGQAATLMQEDVQLIALVGSAIIGLMLGFWKSFKIISFDSDYAHTLGLPVARLDSLLNILVVFAIVLGLQTVGVVLMSSLLLAPAAAARQFTNRLGTMVFLAGIFGASSGLLGTAMSTFASKLPTGPLIVLVATAWVLIAFIFAPQRGLIAYLIRRRQAKNHLE